MQKIYRTVTAFEMRTKISFFIFHGGHDRRNMKKDLEPVSSKIHVKPVLSSIAIFRHSSTVFSFTEQRFCEYETDSRIRGRIVKYSGYFCLPNAAEIFRISSRNSELQIFNFFYRNLPKAPNILWFVVCRSRVVFYSVPAF
jgi:hypothetical protein